MVSPPNNLGKRQWPWQCQGQECHDGLESIISLALVIFPIVTLSYFWNRKMFKYVTNSSVCIDCQKDKDNWGQRGYQEESFRLDWVSGHPFTIFRGRKTQKAHNSMHFWAGISLYWQNHHSFSRLVGFLQNCCWFWFSGAWLLAFGTHGYWFYLVTPGGTTPEP